MNELQNERRRARRFWVAPLVAFGIGVLCGPLVWLSVATALDKYLVSQLPPGLPPASPSFISITSNSGASVDLTTETAFSLIWWPLWILNGFFFAGTTWVFLMLRDFTRLARAK